MKGSVLSCIDHGSRGGEKEVLSIYIASKEGGRKIEHSSGPLEFGREPGLPSGVARVILGDEYISANQMRIEERPGRRVSLQNLSRRVPIGLTGGTSLLPGTAIELELPTRVILNATLIDVDATTAERPADEMATLDPPAATGSVAGGLIGDDALPTLARLSGWFEAVLSLLRASTTRGDFHHDAARAVVELVGLDIGIVLLRQADEWRIVARATREGMAEPPPDFAISRTALDQACRERRTFYRAAGQGWMGGSLAGIEAVVVSPIFGVDDSTIIGAIQGTRLASTGASSTAIRPLEAQLVQVLAAVVGAGTARLGAEVEASRRLVQFEQFFSTELARQLELDPGMLEGRERPITALFSDIRGFSTISERLSPREVCDLVADVMDRMTERVREHDGVVVDYVGDGLLAMWNAPADQGEHARLACQAARAMIGELPGLNDRWRGRIAAPIRLGIGLNTGEALVGNTGSRSRFKYGPLGHSVNLASRVEGATKQFGLPILMTGSTHVGLAGALPTRRICRVYVAGIDGAVDLHELPPGPVDDTWRAARDAYEAGLACFEAGEMADACRLLYPVLDSREGGYDLPTLILLGRAIDRLKAASEPFDPVIRLTSK
jgi:adenylate cyclase